MTSEYKVGQWTWCMGLTHHVISNGVMGTGETRIPSEALICDVPSGRANASLLATAPDLLVALEDLIDRCDDEFDLVMAKQAVARARGLS